MNAWAYRFSLDLESSFLEIDKLSFHSKAKQYNMCKSLKIFTFEKKKNLDFQTETC